MSQPCRQLLPQNRHPTSGVNGGDSRWSSSATGVHSAPSSVDSIGAARSADAGETRRQNDEEEDRQESPVTGKEVQTKERRRNDRFMGLTPPPLPPAMIPSKGRSLHEILRDKKVPEKDKMSSEIDDMVAKANPGEYLLTSASGSTTSASTSPYIQAAFSEISKSDEVPRTLPWDVADMRPRDGRSPYGWSAYNRGSGGSGGNPSVVDGNTYGTSPKHDK